MVEFDKSFLNDWNNLTPLEIEGVKVLEKDMNLILENIPREHIISIYLKGSFLRREMIKGSDVDVVVIFNDDECFKILDQLRKDYRLTKKLEFEFTGYSIKELESGRKSSVGKKDRGSPARFVRTIPNLKLIYGKELELSKLYQKTDRELLIAFIKAFNDIFFPWIDEGKIEFDGLLKQGLWLFELETSVKNPKFKFKSWSELANQYPQEELIHKTLNYRNIKLKDKKKQEKYIQDLKSYVYNLSEEYC